MVVVLSRAEEGVALLGCGGGVATIYVCGVGEEEADGEASFVV